MPKKILIIFTVLILIWCAGCSQLHNDSVTIDIDNFDITSNKNIITEYPEIQISIPTNPLDNNNIVESNKQLLASVPELNIYAYAIEALSDEMMFDIYIEADDKGLLWLYNRPLARSEFRFYYGKFFSDDRDYLIFVDYEHGGHGGGSEKFTILDRESFSIIPVESLPPYDYKLIANDVIVERGEWEFEIPLDKVIEAYNHGNRIAIENDRLVEYSYFFFNVLYDSEKVKGQPTLCFKAEYIFVDEEVRVGALNFVEDEEYYIKN